jgi:uncharacterized membrane protein YdjX (TVP38/TMEM64 family)
MLRDLGATVRRHAGLLKVLAGLLFVAALLVLAQALPLGRFLAAQTGRLHALGPWGPVLLGAVFVVAAVALLPITPITWAAGAVYGPLGGAALVSAASTVAGAVSFLLGRWLAAGGVERRVARSRRLGAVYRALGRGSWKLVGAVRLSHALPFGVQSFLFGLTPVRFGPYLLVTWLTMLPGAFLHAYLGHLGALAVEGGGSGRHPISPGEWALRGVMVVALAGVVFYLGRVVREALRAGAAHDLEEKGVSPAAAEQALEPAAAGWPWGPPALLLAALLALSGAAWVYAAREHVRQVVQGWM